MSRTALFFALAGAIFLTSCKDFVATDTGRATLGSDPTAPRTKWFTDARFGMFIHWGLYSIPAGVYGGKTDYGEWLQESAGIKSTDYAPFATKFNPLKFDADKWAQAAADAGMKYLCITSKHHEGFAMWPHSTTTPDWCLSITPFAKTGRDPLMELKIACEKRGVSFCLYHTIMDWSSVDYGDRRAYNNLPGSENPPDTKRFGAMLHSSVAEVIARYRPRMMWFDGFWEKSWTEKDGRALQDFLRAKEPEMLFNDRVGPGAANLQAGSSEKKEYPFGDFTTPEQHIPKSALPGGRPWETCMTMNDHWGYNAADKNWKSTETLVRQLVETTSKNGNFLLNVGPTAEGEFPEGSLRRLAEIGVWMKSNADSIRGAGSPDFNSTFDWGRATAKPGKIFLHLYRRPDDGKVSVPVKGVKRASLLAGGAEVKFENAGDNTVVTLPEKLADPIDTVVALEV